MENEASERPRPNAKAKMAWRFVGLALVVALLAVLEPMLYSRWKELPVEVLSPSWDRLALAVLLLLASLATSVLQWRRIVRTLGHRLSMIEAVHVLFLSRRANICPAR